MNLRFFMSTIVGLAALLVISPIYAQTSKHEDARQSGLAVKPFAPGERVIFLGDSITHYGTWWPNVWCAYCARFPDKPPLFFNAGFSGDTAAGALSRLDRDVFNKDPDTVCVLFGMNDVRRNSYTVKNTAKDLGSQTRALEKYRVSMDRLLMSIVEKGLRCVVLTPSPYDQTMVNPKAQAVNPGCNDGLAKATQIAKQLAQKYGCEVVDFHGPMTRLNAKTQASDPSATLVSLDRVHPGADGSRMMAELFLSAQGIEPTGLERASAFTSVWEHVTVERNLRNIIWLEDSILTPNQINPEDLGSARTFLKEKYRPRGADNLRLDSYYKWAGNEDELLKILGDLERRLGDGTQRQIAAPKERP